jgi:hypothetical protein
MNARLRASCALAICAGGFVLFSDAAQVVPAFPEHPPTSDADPSTRHEIEVSMPARLSVQRTSSRLSISYDLASVRNVKITVGKNMALGIRDELRVYVKGEARPLQPRSISLGSINEKESAVPLSDPNILKSTEVSGSVQNGIPAPGKQYVIEHDISLFETDIPPQHMWHPEKSGDFKVLWERKLDTLR